MYSKRLERISLVLNVTWLQSAKGKRRGTCGKDQSDLTGIPGHLGGLLLAHFWEYWYQENIKFLKIDSTLSKT